MTSIGITSSSARLLHSWVLHVTLASFVRGTTYAPVPNSAALTSPLVMVSQPPQQGTPIFISMGDRHAGQVVSFAAKQRIVKELRRQNGLVCCNASKRFGHGSQGAPVSAATIVASAPLPSNHTVTEGRPPAIHPDGTKWI